MSKEKLVYEKPSFLAAPIAVICSKSGCPVRSTTSIDERTYVNQKKLIVASIPEVPEDISTRADEGRTYVFEPSVQHVFELNTTGGFILSQIDGKRSISIISEIINKSFSNVPRDVSDDVASFVNSLINAGMKIKIKAKKDI